MDTASEYDLVKQGCNIFSAAGSQIANGTQTFEVNHLKFRILSIHHRIQPHDYRSNEHEHPNYEISFMRTGSMVTTCESSKIRADVNDNRIFFVPPLTLHSRVFGPDPINVNETIMFMITDNDETGRSPIQILPMLIQKKKYSFPFSPELQTLWKLFTERLLDENGNGKIALTILQAWLGIFLLDNFPELLDPARWKKYCQRTDLSVSRDRIATIRNVIEDSIFTNTPLIRYKTRFGLSFRHLNRIFKEETGMTLTQYRLQRKLETAENMLLTSRLAISEIATVLGFSSQEQFAVFFRKHHDCTPSDFRGSNHSDTTPGTKETTI